MTSKVIKGHKSSYHLFLRGNSCSPSLSSPLLLLLSLYTSLSFFSLSFFFSLSLFSPPPPPLLISTLCLSIFSLFLVLLSFFKERNFFYISQKNSIFTSLRLYVFPTFRLYENLWANNPSPNDFPTLCEQF